MYKIFQRIHTNVMYSVSHINFYRRMSLVFLLLLSSYVMWFNYVNRAYELYESCIFNYVVTPTNLFVHYFCNLTEKLILYTTILSVTFFFINNNQP